MTTSNLRAANTHLFHIRVGVGAVPVSADWERTAVGARLAGFFFLFLDSRLAGIVQLHQEGRFPM